MKCKDYLTKENHYVGTLSTEQIYGIKHFGKVQEKGVFWIPVPEGRTSQTAEKCADLPGNDVGHRKGNELEKPKVWGEKKEHYLPDIAMSQLSTSAEVLKEHGGGTCLKLQNGN